MNNTKRNVVLILVDQMRPDFIGPYGCDFLKTPNLDELAANGCTYDYAITASTVCAPARASILTGKNVSGHDSWTNGMPFRYGTEFLPERMNAAGYLTAEVGISDHPGVGYTYKKPFKGVLEWLKERHPEATSYAMYDETGHFKYDEADFYDRYCCDMATDFIDSYVKNGTAPDGTKPPEENAPFFLYCGFMSPHHPHCPPHGYEDAVDMDKMPDVWNSTRQDIAAVEKYRRAFLTPHKTLVDPDSANEERRADRKLYCELIAELDYLVGRIVKSLKDNGVYENTTIIFSSDHGSVQNDYNLISKGPWPYWPQLAVPLIVSNHPDLDKGIHSDALCGNLDIGATVLSCAQDDKAFGTSRSLVGMANGSVADREVNMSEFCDSCKTLMDRQYTFTYYPFTGETALYDRINDPHEMNNLGGNPDYFDVEQKFLMHAIDFMCLAKGVRIEAHDLVREVREGIEKKHPKFLDNFDVCYPLSSWREVERLEEAGLDATYNDFIRERPIKAHYGYFCSTERPEKK